MLALAHHLLAAQLAASPASPSSPSPSSSSSTAPPAAAAAAPAPARYQTEVLPKGAPRAREAIRTAHCAVLRIDAHPVRLHMALASRICMRPGVAGVVEERGVVDMKERRFTFVSRPFATPAACAPDPAEQRRGLAVDDVSRALRSRTAAECLFDHADVDETHFLYRWRRPFDAELAARVPDEHRLVEWSGTGRFVAIHHPPLEPVPHAAAAAGGAAPAKAPSTKLASSAAPSPKAPSSSGAAPRELLPLETTIIDAKAMTVVAEKRVYLYGWLGEIATMVVAGCRAPTWERLRCSEKRDGSPVGLQYARVDFTTAPPAVNELGLHLNHAGERGWSTACEGGVMDGAEVSHVDVFTFDGFDARSCALHATRVPQ